MYLSLMKNLKDIERQIEECKQTKNKNELKELIEYTDSANKEISILEMMINNYNTLLEQLKSQKEKFDTKTKVINYYKNIKQLKETIRYDLIKEK